MVVVRWRRATGPGRRLVVEQRDVALGRHPSSALARWAVPVSLCLAVLSQPSFLQPLAAVSRDSKSLLQRRAEEYNFGSPAARAVATEVAAKRLEDVIPMEAGQNSDQVGFEQLCTRWNREEAEAVAKSKRTLQSPNTTKDQKMKAIDELEYWAIRRGGYDAEIVLIGTLKSTDRELAGQAHISLKKTWGNHFNAWVNSAIGNAKALQNQGNVEEALKIFDRIVFNNPLWGEGYHFRAKCHNQMGDLNKTIQDLRSTLEFCPNNYVAMTELGITLMDKFEEYEEAAELFQNAGHLCPLLPIEAFEAGLYAKAPHLRPEPEQEFQVDEPPVRLLPDHWVNRFEATERPNQAFLRVGAEIEQWFREVQKQQLSRQQQRKLWSVLAIKWDPDKFPRPLRSFTTQVHELLKSRRERELKRALQEDDPKAYHQTKFEEEEGDDARAFLRRIREARREKRERATAV